MKWKLELKCTISELKYSTNGLMSRMSMTEETPSESEDSLKIYPI